ncbi:MAG: SufE family protein [Bacteroidaceae bacterium]|nr:SufE family protein [Bacteroidaceae bacterium]
MATINELQEEIVEEFSSFDDWMDKYQMIIDLGNELPAMDEKFKTDDNLIEGCQSRVWVHAYIENGVMKLEADSDAIITKGLIGLLIRIWSDQTPQDILKCGEPYFIEAIGLKDHLSPTRSNGLASMVRQIQIYALAFSNGGHI